MVFDYIIENSRFCNKNCDNMSYCVSHGKDKVMFLTKEDLSKPSSIVLPEDDEPRGLLLPNGEINWGCPCLGNMAVGPCSVEFRESLTCFHNSTADPKGSDCLEQFREMNECMSRYPALYKKSDDDENALESLDDENALESLDEENEESLNSLPSVPNSTSETVTETANSEK